MTRLLLSGISFLVQEEHEPGGRYDVIAKGTIDGHGHISVLKPTPHRAEGMTDYREREQAKCEAMREALVERGFAEWRNIGAGDTELYATEALYALVAPAITALPSGWTAWQW